MRLTFNLVPSMLVQLEAFARDEARDRHLEIGLKPAERLTDEERAFCVGAVLPRAPAADDRAVSRATPSCSRCATRAASAAERRRAPSRFSVDDLRDLQVWHKLAWIDPFYFEPDARVRALVAKGRDFTEDDKAHAAATSSSKSCAAWCPSTATAAARGQVELSTSPFYHPILPLLCDTDVYLRTHPAFADAARARSVIPKTRSSS